jgi:pimeloyl-ACP methyl ester carboxylesterase
MLMADAAPTMLPSFKADTSRARYTAAYDAVVAAWPVPCEALDVPTRLGMTHVIASGPADAPPLVLLPSFAGTATAWRLNVAGLGERFRTYAVDVIGQPGKSLANRRLRNARDYGEWLTDVLDGLKVHRASLVGCSFGGFVALNQARLTPERVERIVLISPVGSFTSQFWTLTFIMRVRTPLLRFLRRFTGRRRAPGMADLGRDTAPMAPPRDLLWAALMGVTMTERPTVSVISPPVFTTAQLRSIRAPTLLLIGENERLYAPQATLDLAKRRMPALQVAIVPNADHIAAMAQPEDVNARVLRFLGP